MKTDVSNAVMHLSIFVIVKKYRKIFLFKKKTKKKLLQNYEINYFFTLILCLEEILQEIFVNLI